MSKPIRVGEVRHAGWVGEAEYGVVEVTGGEPSYCRRPCPECPWRTDVPVGVFPAEAFRISAPTAYDMATRVFACHMAGRGKPRTCAGFLMRAHHNLSVRLGMIQGRIDPRQLSEDGVPLYEDYRAMAEANGVAADDPVLGPCR